MKLLFKQRFFCLLDNFDILNEKGEKVFVAEGQLAIGHCFKIYDASDREVGMVKQKIFAWLPRFAFYAKGRYIGQIKKRLTMFRPVYDLDFNGWHMEGNLFEWDYRIMDATGRIVAKISKELMNWTDTYSIDVANSEDALTVLMIVLTIDAEKCSRNN